eukprot:9788778-Ditylum_brightwellii.AAC.1
MRYATAKAIDYNTSEGLEHWMYSTSKLLGELYYCQSEQLNPFFKALQKRTWNSACDIPGSDIIITPDD